MNRLRTTFAAAGAFLSRWQEFIVWLPGLVVLTLIGFVVLGAFTSLGGDAIAWLAELPVLCAYAAAALAFAGYGLGTQSGDGVAEARRSATDRPANVLQRAPGPIERHTVGLDALADRLGVKTADLRAALDFLAREKMDLIVTSGGLGPTADDLTAEVVAACFVIDLPELGGAAKLREAGVEVRSLMSFGGH